MNPGREHGQSGSRLFIDFETFSTLDLKRVGTHEYADPQQTDAWCMGFAWDSGDVALWKGGEPLYFGVEEHVEAGGEVWAHNVAFEFAIWNRVMVPRYGWPALRIE